MNHGAKMTVDTTYLYNYVILDTQTHVIQSVNHTLYIAIITVPICTIK